MELYVDPIATTSRAVLALCRHETIDVAVRSVALMHGEHHRPPLCELNPNRLVPVLVDGDFVLTEASAILRYLARSRGSALYPAELTRAARVDELIAWFEANFYRDFGYQYVYPQLMPHHRRASDDATAATIGWGREHSRRWLKVLDTHFLAHGARHLCGVPLTIADFFGASILSLGELVQYRLDDFPRVQRWYAAMDEHESWRASNVEFKQFARSLQGRDPVALRDEHAGAA